MKTCVYCGSQLADQARACSYCGRPVEDAQTGPDGQTAASEPERNQDQGQGSPVYGAENQAGGQGTPGGAGGRPGQDAGIWGRPDMNRQPSFGSQGYNPAAGGYGMGGQWMGGPMAPPPVSNGFATASFVLSLAGILTDLFLYGIPSLIAVVLGIVALRQIAKTTVPVKNKWMAITGVAVGGVLFLMTVLLYGFSLMVLREIMQDPSLSMEFEDMIRQMQGAFALVLRSGR